MYEVVSVGKLSETQKSKLRNGHPVRVKKGSGNKLSLTHDQIKKLESAAKKRKAVTITLHQEQAEKQIELERMSSVTQNHRDAEVASRVANEPTSSMPNGR